MKLTKIFGIVLSLHVGVILLVMFQPGCQTMEKKEPVDLGIEKVEVQDVGSFNQGLPKTETPDIEAKPVNEFSEPSRPVVGELFVPNESTDSITPSPLPTIIEEGSGVSNAINLRPANMTVYKIVKGDTLWGIARKNDVTLNNVLKSNPNIDKNSRLKIGQEIMIPSVNDTVTVPKSISPVPPLVDTSSSTSTYTVMGGDSLSKIARKSGVSLRALMNINGMSNSSVIRPGQILVIPSEGNSESFISPARSITIPEGANTHVVKKGENLTRIASIYGTTIQKIMELNNLSDAGRIRVGESLIVSDSNFIAPQEEVDSQIVPLDQDSSLQNFFKGESEEKPIIDVPEQP